jgi:SAM-dependent methyltransferase
MGEQAVADTLVLPKQPELTPALRNLIETVIPGGSHCLNVGRRARAINISLSQHGCTHLTVDESHVPALPFESESFDAALLIGVLDRLAEPYRAARQLHRILRPGGVLLVTTANDCYWRRRLGRVVGGEPRRPGPSGSYSPTTLRRLLLDAGFNLVGVEGQDGALVRELPVAGRFARGHTSTPYRVAERFLPTLLGAQVGAFAVRL